MKTPYPFPYIKLSRLIIGSLFILATAAACQKQPLDQSVVSQLFEDKLNGRHVFLFVPLDGCGTCIKNSSAFINKNLAKEEKLKAYVYSLYRKKYLQFDSAVKQSDRFIIDSEGKILTTLHVEAKPRVIFLENGEIVEDLFYDNENDNAVFEKILSY